MATVSGYQKLLVLGFGNVVEGTETSVFPEWDVREVTLREYRLLCLVAEVLDSSLGGQARQAGSTGALNAVLKGKRSPYFRSGDIRGSSHPDRLPMEWKRILRGGGVISVSEVCILIRVPCREEEPPPSQKHAKSVDGLMCIIKSRGPGDKLTRGRKAHACTMRDAVHREQVHP
ncbi:hypothetical protein B0H14DRAFT_2564180 [Mycena olivaceomarginata]|nr:hypothetical protein B0H14DRAFT_2564180 [Mycena olivaceomarginata]